MGDTKLPNSLANDCNPPFLVPGTIIDVCGGDEGIYRTFREMLNEKLLWMEKEYCPIGVPQRLLPSPLLSDTEGLRIMRAIRGLPTYYQTDDKVELFKDFGYEVANLIPPNAILLDLGYRYVLKPQ